MNVSSTYYNINKTSAEFINEGKLMLYLFFSFASVNISNICVIF